LGRNLRNLLCGGGGGVGGGGGGGGVGGGGGGGGVGGGGGGGGVGGCWFVNRRWSHEKEGLTWSEFLDSSKKKICRTSRASDLARGKKRPSLLVFRQIGKNATGKGRKF